MEKEDKFLIAETEDLIDKARREDRIVYSDFLDMRSQSLVEKACRDSGLNFFFDGGYDTPERRILVFLPSWAGMENYKEESPLEILRVIHKEGGRELSHRDYLGSVLGLGITRDKIGDIIVYPKGADIIILKDMEEFLLSNYDKAGKTELSLSIEKIEMLNLSNVKTVEITDTIASLRLDAVLASGFRCSRTKASEAVKQGFVFLNGVQVVKPDKEVKMGDVFVLRGRGKCVLEQVGGNSKKGRTFITLKRYM